MALKINVGVIQMTPTLIMLISMDLLSKKNFVILAILRPMNIIVALVAEFGIKFVLDSRSMLINIIIIGVICIIPTLIFKAKRQPTSILLLSLYYKISTGLAGP